MKQFGWNKAEKATLQGESLVMAAFYLVLPCFEVILGWTQLYNFLAVVVQWVLGRVLSGYGQGVTHLQ